MEPHKPVIEAYEDALKTAGGLLKGFSPVNRTSGEVDGDLRTAVTELAELTDAEIAIVGMKRSDLLGRASQIPPVPPPPPPEVTQQLLEQTSFLD